jgi:hypothetical protein
MSPVELFEGFRWAYKETFKVKNILARTIHSGRNFPIAFVGNLTYRIFVKRLFRGKGFEMPVPDVSPKTNSQYFEQLKEQNKDVSPLIVPGKKAV